MRGNYTINIINGGKYGTMNDILAINQELSPGFKARKLRTSQMLTQRELANLAGVSRSDVSLLEHDLPLRLEARVKLFKTLWARKVNRV